MCTYEISSAEDHLINSILDEGIIKMQNSKSNQNLNLQKKPHFSKEGSSSHYLLSNSKSRDILTLENNNDFLVETRRILHQPLNIKQNTICSKNINTNQQISKKSNSTAKLKIDYKSKFEKLQNKVIQTKSELVIERKTNNELKKQFDKAIKKEEQYENLKKQNEQLVVENEELFNKIVDSENIRKEQEKLLMTLKIEYNRLKKFFIPEDEENKVKIRNSNLNEINNTSFKSKKDSNKKKILKKNKSKNGVSKK